MAYPAGDHAEILNILATYSIALDRGDAERLRGCFHPHARITFAGTEMGREDFVGALGPMLEVIRGIHINGNQAVSIDGDHATVESRVYAVHMIPTTEGNPSGAAVFGAIDTPTDSMIVGEYDDVLDRIDGVWRITARTINFIWQAHVPPFALPWAGNQG